MPVTLSEAVARANAERAAATQPIAADPLGDALRAMNRSSGNEDVLGNAVRDAEAVMTATHFAPKTRGTICGALHDALDAARDESSGGAARLTAELGKLRDVLDRDYPRPAPGAVSHPFMG